MITRMAGVLHAVDGLVATVEVGPFWYEVMVPTSVVTRLPRPGEKIVLHTYSYIDGAGNFGAMHQRLIGFLDQVEREFFLLFTSVSGLGLRKGARAMALPVSRLAAAIEHADERALKNLPEIGPKTAKKIIAELQGKMGKFALLRESRAATAGTTSAPTGGQQAEAAATNGAPAGLDAGDGVEYVPSAHPSYEIIDDARSVLVSLLHYSDREAQQMIDRALAIQTTFADADELLQHIFRLRGKTSS